MRKLFPYTKLIGKEAWLMQSLSLHKSGIIAKNVYEDPNDIGLSATWEIHLKVTRIDGIMARGRTIVEFIMNPRMLEDSIIEKVYNPDMENWFTEEEAEKIRTRILRLLNLPEELPIWGPAPSKSKTGWTPDQLDIILNLPEDSLEHGLDLIRRKITYQKFGL